MAKEKATPEVIQLTNVRLSFPKLFQPDENGKYGAAFIIDPETTEGKAAFTAIVTEARRLAKAEYGSSIPAEMKALFEDSQVMEIMYPKGPICIKDGNKTDYEEYAGKYYLNASNSEARKPKVVKRVDGMFVEADADDLYSGCYVHATIALWAQNNEHGKKINANLRTVAKYKDGERLSGGTADPDKDLAGLDFEDDDFM